MAMELVKREIDKKTYEFEQFNARHSVKVFTRLVKLLGEPLVLAMSAAGMGDPAQRGKAFKDRSLKGDLVAKAVHALAGRMDEEEVLDLMEVLIGEGAVTCNGRKVIFDTHYAGQFGHMLKVLAAAVEVQYGNFLDDLYASQGSAQGSMSPDPQASSGSSGAQS